jgi:hypothetical protein
MLGVERCPTFLLRGRRHVPIPKSTKTTMNTDAATIPAGTAPRGEEGAVALLGGQSRVCVDFGQPSPSLTLSIVAAVD